MSCPIACCNTDSCNILDPKKYNDLESYTKREDMTALERTVFLESPEEDHTHLNIGCGPGTFTKTYLLPRSLPCKTLVAGDRSPTMVEFARENSAHESVAFDVFDFCGEDAGKLIAKYGRFNWIYSFLCSYYVQEERKAFMEVARLLTPNSGECLITSANSTALFDAWLELYLMKRWRETIPDPWTLFSEQFSFHFGKSKAQVESDVRLMASRAGLKCVALHVYETAWSFPTDDACSDAMAEPLGFRKYVSQADFEELKADMARAINGGSAPKENEYFMKNMIYSLHAESARI